jgi:DNA-binding transcriptional ArsR family regulator
MFKDIFGNSPQTKILDFLADHPEYDYSVSEIASHSLVSRPTVYKIIDILLEKQLVIRTREQGTSSLFKLNLENRVIQLLLQFDFELAGKTAARESKKQKTKEKQPVISSLFRKNKHQSLVNPSR